MRHRGKLRGAFGAAAALACVAAPLAASSAADPGDGPALPRVVVKKPSPDAINAAIAAVDPGGTVRIRKGRYRESLFIEKPVKLVAAGKGRPTIDGRCEAPSAVAIHSPGVTLKGLKVIGGREFANVDFAGVPSGRAHDLKPATPARRSTGSTSSRPAR